jgi:hypothetical protein
MKYVKGHEFSKDTTMDIIGKMVLTTVAGVLVFIGFYATSYIASDILNIEQKAAAYAAFIVATPVIMVVTFVKNFLFEE